MTAFPYRLRAPQSPTMGLIVLRVDETIEQDFRRFFAPGMAPAPTRLYVSRVHSGEDLTPDSIARMEAGLGAAAALLPPAAECDVVGYACTSGTALIGAQNVRAVISAHTPTRAVTDPLTAAVAALRALSLRRIGIVSPYTPQVAAPLRAAFVAEGIEVPDTVSFGEEVEARVARIDPSSICEAARAIAARSQLDGVFLSCTNLQTCDILEGLSAELGLPVLSSNLVLAWHMAQLAGVVQADLSPRAFFQVPG